MIKTYIQFIKSLRVQKGISQQEIAHKLGISRTSYIAVEQGKRELLLSEAQKLSDIFGISLKDMETGVAPDYEKYKEMLLAYLRVASSNSDGKIPKTKLAKLLYLADFAWFYEKMQSMSGMQYKRIKYGPVPDSYFRALDELEEQGKVNIDRSNDGIILIREGEGSKRRQLNKLSKEEKYLIKQIAKKWKNKKTQEIVDFTHEQLPYRLCALDEVIPYELIIQEDPAYVY
ncbi:MAG: type II toxin-antitoxin system antitoxin SocA domain-containing protein [bacterium]